MFGYVPPSSPETDADLRIRVAYVSGDGPPAFARIMQASGDALEYLAHCVNLRRLTGRERDLYLSEKVARVRP